MQQPSFSRSLTNKRHPLVIWLFIALSMVTVFVLQQNGACTPFYNSHSTNVEAQTHDEQVNHHHQNRPFPMPIRGKAYEIFQPLYDMDDSKKNAQLFLPPKEFIGTFEERISWAGSMVQIDEKFKDLTPKEHAALMYLDMMKSFVSGRVFRNAELSVKARLGRAKLRTGAFDESLRDEGYDWTFAGDTMTGQKRLDNVHALLKDVIENKVIGDYIETGVWRGGSSVLAKAVLEVLDPNSNRVSYVCDSFMGLPPGEKKLSSRDAGWDNTPYLEVSADIVANNFIKYGLLDSNVVFAKGFFNETMPPLAEKITSLSVMRLDGDMYESTVDVLYHLYDKLSIGGYVIMDDWFGFPSKTACEDFLLCMESNLRSFPLTKSRHIGKRLKISKFNTGVMNSLNLLYEPK